MCFFIYSIIDNCLQAVFWVETKGKTLEEIDAIFDDNSHSTIRNVEDVRKGRELVDVSKVEQQLQEEIGDKDDRDYK